MRKLIASVIVSVGLVALAPAALACEGYWDCQWYDGVVVCYYYG